MRVNLHQQRPVFRLLPAQLQFELALQMGAQPNDHVAERGRHVPDLMVHLQPLGDALFGLGKFPALHKPHRRHQAAQRFGDAIGNPNGREDGKHQQRPGRNQDARFQIDQVGQQFLFRDRTHQHPIVELQFFVHVDHVLALRFGVKHALPRPPLPDLSQLVQHRLAEIGQWLAQQGLPFAAEQEDRAVRPEMDLAERIFEVFRTDIHFHDRGGLRDAERPDGDQEADRLVLLQAHRLERVDARRSPVLLGLVKIFIP
ncbi:hypothetical protein D3C76_1038750 [compost metagenome]